MVKIKKVRNPKPWFTTIIIVAELLLSKVASLMPLSSWGTKRKIGCLAEIANIVFSLLVLSMFAQISGIHREAFAQGHTANTGVFRTHIHACELPEP